VTQNREHLDVAVTFVPMNEGGRSSAPIARGYAPHFRVGERGEYLGVRFISGNELTLGAEVMATVELLYPWVDYSALVAGAHFQVLEGPNIVATGKVLRRHGDPSNDAAA
jgi:hypothetical protein